MSTEYGPFVHGLNKGGLAEIIASQSLRASAAAQIAGGAEAVRAHRGSFSNLHRKFGWGRNPTGKLFIEFYTLVEPRSGTPPGYAEWRMPEGEHLQIRITAVYDDHANERPMREFTRAR